MAMLHCLRRIRLLSPLVPHRHEVSLEFAASSSPSRTIAPEPNTVAAALMVTAPHQFHERYGFSLQAYSTERLRPRSDACYKTLLPYAGSFNGSIARVARAATAVVAARQHGFADELARLKLRGTGAGPRADMTLASCYEEVASNDMDDGNETLGRLDRLVAGRSKDEFDWESSLVVLWLGSTLGVMEDCTDWLNDAGKAAASSPVVKEVIAGCAALSPYIRIALHLAHAIKF
uniref:Pectinesterase inhibitor domain-containing protein n=1 Tax=Setaria viridis TaxID=4556 RepID=A0A4U6SU91_SETVI|nr:LOW QUALITY PROTEIN: hypothetical protein SEVIR_9G158500v2 [Setaria viridis]